MIRLVQGELLKLRTTQVWFWLLLATLAISALVCIASIANGDVRTTTDVANMFANANGALMTVFVLGVLGVTTEFRYQTITPTVLATPSRWAIVGAKLIAYALVGLAYAVAAIALQLAIAVPWLSAKGVDYSLSDSHIRRVLIGLVAIFVLFAIVGIGIGALLRNQIVAVSVGLIFLLVLQNIVGAIPKVKQAWPYMPAGGVTGILYTGDAARFNDVPAFGVAGSLAVLLAWAFIPAVIGAGWTMNRDIT